MYPRFQGCCCPHLFLPLWAKPSFRMDFSPQHHLKSIWQYQLDFYATLFEWSCNAVNAMAAALNTFYMKHGFYFLNNKVWQSLFSCSLVYSIFCSLTGQQNPWALSLWLGLYCTVAGCSLYAGWVKVRESLTASDQMLQPVDAPPVIAKNDPDESNMVECMCVLQHSMSCIFWWYKFWMAPQRVCAISIYLQETYSY